ncbi:MULTISPECIES: hypothetical protein [Nostocales]|nr:hypothetical protein [Tolypothrix bouteillei]
MIIAASNQLQKRERKKGIAIFFIFLISLLLSILGLLNLFIILMGPIWCSQTPRSKAYAVEVTQDLAELAPLPKSATHIKTEMKGGAFDRTVVVTFEALKSDIEEWLMASQGTSELVPEKLPDKSLKYSISSGNGGQVALLVLSADKRKVKIQVAYWL